MPVNGTMKKEFPMPIGVPDWTRLRTETFECAAGEVIFAQGDPATTVLYLEEGAVRLSVLSLSGKQGVVAVLEPGHFFGEGCLAGQSERVETATTMAPCTILSVPQQEMVRQLGTDPAFADRFLAHMLKRNIRIEEDLIDHLFNSSEKRLARALLLLARQGESGSSHVDFPGLSQGFLAEMVGTTRSRVNFFLNRFRKRGFVDYESKGALKINNSLRSVVLRE